MKKEKKERKQTYKMNSGARDGSKLFSLNSSPDVHSAALPVAAVSTTRLEAIYT